MLLSSEHKAQFQTEGRVPDWPVLDAKQKKKKKAQLSCRTTWQKVNSELRGIACTKSAQRMQIASIMHQLKREIKLCLMNAG